MFGAAPTAVSSVCHATTEPHLTIATVGGLIKKKILCLWAVESGTAGVR